MFRSSGNKRFTSDCVSNRVQVYIFVASQCRVSSQRYQSDRDDYRRHARALRISGPMPLKSGLSLVTEGSPSSTSFHGNTFRRLFPPARVAPFPVKFSATVLESSGRCSSHARPFHSDEPCHKRVAVPRVT